LSKTDRKALPIVSPARGELTVKAPVVFAAGARDMGFDMIPQRLTLRIVACQVFVLGPMSGLSR
jgi:hypothetical protein